MVRRMQLDGPADAFGKELNSAFLMVAVVVQKIDAGISGIKAQEVSGDGAVARQYVDQGSLVGLGELCGKRSQKTEGDIAGHFVET